MQNHSIEQKTLKEVDALRATTFYHTAFEISVSQPKVLVLYQFDECRNLKSNVTQLLKKWYLHLIQYTIIWFQATIF